ncbi:hypothetical protein LEP1GSC202_2022 [Leptospira yanagawae serovar Saopaulo str. Sao Paulo = ATCC 700523]|uniref:Uncharacterized protein n=1 Tax=Leptospira yanagawae serovar Saopaulo str. Sao Paulo = ATCC 700523 TaxID=1249483 RepID=A0A5E8HAE9_9LEPT|nr:hypothetical protein LEP1GSC202_2022 [Leptospira yanagawae serovar Saopaulo str. Sao Paulo = ATCC 700523]
MEMPYPYALAPMFRFLNLNRVITHSILEKNSFRLETKRIGTEMKKK